MKAKTRPKKLIALLLAAAIAFSAVGATGTALAEGGPAPFSLLPLEDEAVDVYFDGYTEEELMAMPLSTILSRLTYRYDKAPDEEKGTLGHSAGDPVTIGENDVIVLGETDGGYRFMERSDTVDLTTTYKTDNSYTKSLELIIGSGKQLDKENARFNITVHVTKKFTSEEKLTLYTLENGERKDLTTTTTQANRSYVYLYPHFTYETLWSLIEEGNLYIEVEGTLIEQSSGTAADVQFDVSFNTSEKTENGYRLKRTYDYFNFTYSIGDTVYASGRYSVYLEGNAYDVNCELKDSSRYPYSSYSYLFSDQISKTFNVYDRSEPLPYYYFQITDRNIRLEKDGPYAYGSIQKVVQGEYASAEEAADAEDVTDRVFNGEYIIDYSTYDTGVYFTLLYEEANDNGWVDGLGEVKSIVLHVSLYNSYFENIGSSVIVDRPTVGVTDPYFDIYAIYAATEDGNKSTKSIEIDDYSSYGIQDSYYGYGYHTWFLDNQTSSYYDPEPVDPSSLSLRVNTDRSFNVYDATKSNLINFDEPQDFSGEKVQYTVSNGEKTLNRFVSIVMKSENGPRLYVCGPEKREIYFDKHYFGEYHDILIANPGNENLTGLKVEWVAAPRNVKIDDYWTVGGERNDTLEPISFSGTYYNENNFAKIRLVPNGDGEVSGTLKISADGQEPYYIELSGHAGDPKIVTESPLTNAVKYVPYNAIIATDKIHDWQTITFECYGLPEGLSMNGKTGEIYGVPQEAGEYTFAVQAEVTYPSSSGYENYFYVNKEFELTVLENTDLNVYNEADENYQILTPVGTEQTPGARNYYLETANTDQLFVSNGVYGEFIDLWLNGQKLNRGEDYTVESGSTRITIKSQTFSKLEKDQTNTLAAEFRVDGDLSKDLKRTPQNFIIGNPPPKPTPVPPTPGSLGNTGNTQTSGTDGQNNNNNASDPVQKVIDQIKNLPDTITEADRGSVEAARKAYDALTDEQKKWVENYEDLLDAEQALKDLEPEEDNEEEENYDDNAFSDDESGKDDENDVELNDDESSGSDVGSTENASDGVTLFGVIIDQNGTPISGLSMELHSAVQNVSTSRDGRYQFDAAEFGEHTLILTNKTTGVSAEKTFTLVESDRVSIQDNVIYAPNGTNISLSMVFNGENITFLQPDDPRLVEYDGSVPTGVSLVVFPCLLAAGALIAAAPKRKKRG